MARSLSFELLDDVSIRHPVGKAEISSIPKATVERHFIPPLEGLLERLEGRVSLARGATDRRDSQKALPIPGPCEAPGALFASSKWE